MLNLATGCGPAAAERRLADLLAILGGALDGTLPLPVHPEPVAEAVP